MPAPTVTAASPNIGSTQGGTNITLTGTNFTGATGVTIGGVAATDVVVVSATSITCTTPTGSAGVGSILVTNASGTNGANSLFFYIAATPTDTYIYLRGGRGDGFVPTWTGTVAEQGMVDTSGAIVGSDGKEGFVVSVIQDVDGQCEAAFFMVTFQRGFEGHAQKGDGLEKCLGLNFLQNLVVLRVDAQAEGACVFEAHGQGFTTKLTLSSKSVCIRMLTL